MSDHTSPDSEAEVAHLVKEACDAKRPLKLVGGGTKAGFGRPINTSGTLDLGRLSGISLYEPGALTIIAQAGTPLADVEAALAAEGQRLPFEPMGYNTVFGTSGTPTIGGTVAINNSGPRRIQAGACRDSLIGVRFVSGEGEIIKNGGRVMKNVTGLDLVKLMCGAHGTLGVLTEVAFKVLPANAREATLLFEGSSVESAVGLMSKALCSPFEVTGAVHFPQAGGQTALRVEGFEGQVDYKLEQLRALLATDSTVLEGVAHDALWQRARSLEDFAGTAPLWRISVKPSNGPEVVAALEAHCDAKVMMDWGGGLIWAEVADETQAAAEIVREAVGRLGGHATLVRESDALRGSVPVFQPQPARLAEISEDLRRRFDPAGVLNPGLMAA